MAERHERIGGSPERQPLTGRDGTAHKTEGPIIAVPGGQGGQKLPPLAAKGPQAHDVPWEGPVLSPVKGGKPEKTPGVIISMPQGGGDVPRQTGEGIISMPGRGEINAAEADGRQQQGKPVDVVVYLMDKTGLHFHVDDGQHATAGELFEFVMEELHFPPEARDVFSLWMVSDLLELQLKPHQVPFKLACYWDELLEKYSSAELEDIERDEPIVMFQRNVFHPKANEQSLNHPEMLRLLYHEAKEAVVDARFPVSHEGCVLLAGIQSQIEHGRFLRDHHNAKFYKEKLSTYLPMHFTHKKFFRSGPANDLVNSHMEANRKLGELHTDESKMAAYRTYLRYCWNLPCYGSAFFRGQIEYPGTRLAGSPDNPVYIAINVEGVFIIDMDDVESLLGLCFEDMSWEYAEPKDASNRNCFPCLFLQFSLMEGREKVSKVLQIFSREASLMDSLITACLAFKKSARSAPAATTKALDGDGDSSKDQWRKYNKLCLTTFQKGKLVSTMARKPSTKKKT